MSIKTYLITSIIVFALLIGWGFSEIKSTQNSQGTFNHKLQSLVQKQGTDREAAVLKNVAARKQDCEESEVTRKALRENVEQGQKETPLLLKLLPSLNTKDVLAKSRASDARQLSAFKPRNCEAYALESVPTYERHKLSLEEQQAELKKTQDRIRSVVTESATARVVTVRSRCELTGLIINVLKKDDPGKVASFTKSYDRCLVQLHSVEKLAAQAQATP